MKLIIILLLLSLQPNKKIFADWQMCKRRQCTAFWIKVTRPVAYVLGGIIAVLLLFYGFPTGIGWTCCKVLPIEHVFFCATDNPSDDWRITVRLGYTFLG